MTAIHRPLAGAALLVGVMFAANLFGPVLDRFFLAFPGIDKVLHLLFHATLFLFVRAGFVALGAPRPWQRWGPVGIGLTLAGLDELVQSLAPARTVELGDLVADCSGIALGWASTARARRAAVVAVSAAAVCAGAYVTYDTHVRLREYVRGLEFERKLDFSQARIHYLRALRSGLRSASLYNALAWTQVESGEGDLREAVAYADMALKLRPGNADFLDTFGWALHRSGRSAEALGPLQGAYAQSPDMYCIHYHLGAVYAALGRTAEAVTHLRKQAARTDTREAALATEALAAMGEQP